MRFLARFRYKGRHRVGNTPPRPLTPTEAAYLREAQRCLEVSSVFGPKSTVRFDFAPPLWTTTSRVEVPEGQTVGGLTVSPEGVVFHA